MQRATSACGGHHAKELRLTLAFAGFGTIDEPDTTARTSVGHAKELAA